MLNLNYIIKMLFFSLGLYYLIEVFQIFVDINLIIMLVGLICVYLMYLNIYVFINSLYLNGISNILIKYHYIFFILQLIYNIRVDIFRLLSRDYLFLIYLFQKFKVSLKRLNRVFLSYMWMNKFLLNFLNNIKKDWDFSKFSLKSTDWDYVLWVLKKKHLRNINFFLN